jgi:hypothetical protein
MYIDFVFNSFPSSFVRCPSQQLDPQKTVFVGALHGMLTAEGLCNIFNDLFGGVVYASKSFFFTVTSFPVVMVLNEYIAD